MTADPSPPAPVRSRRRAVALAAAAVAALLVVAWVLVPAFTTPDGPPGRVWTRDPLPDIADASPGLVPAEIHDAPAGRRIRGWDLIWNPRFGPLGGPRTLWEFCLLEHVSFVDGILGRFRDDVEVCADFDVMPRYRDTGVVEERDGATWRAWDR
jgi:hypothetical protein